MWRCGQPNRRLKKEAVLFVRRNITCRCWNAFPKLAEAPRFRVVLKWDLPGQSHPDKSLGPLRWRGGRLCRSVPSTRLSVSAQPHRKPYPEWRAPSEWLRKHQSPRQAGKEREHLHRHIMWHERKRVLQGSRNIYPTSGGRTEETCIWKGGEATPWLWLSIICSKAWLPLSGAP